MSVSNRRVVLTGLGVLCPLGLTAAELWDSLKAGRSGVRPITAFDAAPLPTRIAGIIPQFDAKKYLAKDHRKNLRVMAKTIQLGVAAAQVAMDDAKVDRDALDPTRFGVEFGASLIASELVELGPAALVTTDGDREKVDLKTWGEQGIASITPLWMLKYLPNMPACHVSIIQNAQGPSNSITENEVAGLLALAEAVRILKRDQADFFLVGASDGKVNPLSMVRQALFANLSKQNDTPETAVKPFDRRRDGTVLGEGGGVLAVEELEHAKRRGATILAEVVGQGSAFDRGLTGQGVARAIHAALRQAGLTPADLDHVNAHGLGSVKLDVTEAQGIKAALGDAAVPVWAVKSYLGNLGAGGGLVELAASVLALRHGELPPTRNFEEPDPACPVTVLREARPVTKPYVLKVSFTDMGQVAAVVIRRWDE